MEAHHLDTLAVHAGRDELADLGVHALPIDLSTTNPLPDLERGGDAYETMATGGRPGAGDSRVYQRLWNPTVARSRTPWPASRAVPRRSPSAPAWRR